MWRNKKTTEEFIEEARLVHGDKYDYSRVEYKNSYTKVCIICHEKDENGIEHGEFYVIPNNHLTRKSGCPKCADNTCLTTNRFVERAIKVHGNKYDYSKVEYVNNKTKVYIICPIHGEFKQIPNDHLQGKGCPKCGKVFRYNTEDFIEKAREIHGDKYDYTKVNYINNSTKVCITCPTHGEFWQIPMSHLAKHGCDKCAKEKIGDNFRSNKEEFIEKAISVHGDRYDYSKVTYLSAMKKVCIICQKHGEFWQIPASHLRGRGCPCCQNSTLENEVKIFLDSNDIQYEEQKTFDWLKYEHKQRLDFFLPKYNIAIECQGIQHFKGGLFGKQDKTIEETLDKIKTYDLNKKRLCEEHGIKILYFSNLGIEYPYNVFEDKELLLKEIRYYGKNKDTT